MKNYCVLSESSHLKTLASLNNKAQNIPNISVMLSVDPINNVSNYFFH